MCTTISEKEELASSVESKAGKPSSKTSEELFPSADKDGPDSDSTLVGDSDDSLGTVVPSPPRKPVIINDSDSNSTAASRSNLSAYNYSPDEILPTLAEEDNASAAVLEASFTRHVESRRKSLHDQTISRRNSLYTFNFTQETQPPDEPVDEHEVSFSQYLGSRQKALDDQGSRLSLPAQKDSDIIVTLTPKTNPPSTEDVVNSLESYGLPGCVNVQPFFSDQADADAQSNVNGLLFRVRGPANLPAFRPSLESVTSLGDWRRMKVREFRGNVDSGNLRLKLADREKVVSTRPVQLPPDRKSVEGWLEERRRLAREEERLKRKQEERSEDGSQRRTQESDGSALGDAFLNLSRAGTEASRHLGVSCGQIEFNTRASVGNIANENLANAKALATVIAGLWNVDVRSVCSMSPRRGF